MPSFVDTNVLVYAEDRDAKAKHRIASDLLVERWHERDGMISVQVLQEFYVTVTRKLKKPAHERQGTGDRPGVSDLEGRG